MRISGTEPSSVILSQRSSFKNWKGDLPKVPKQAEAEAICIVAFSLGIITNVEC